MKKLDLILLIPVILLTLFGLLMIYDASSYVAFRDFGSSFHFLREQAFWAIIGFFFLIFFYFFDYKKLHFLALPILLGSIVLLVLIFVPGLGVNVMGARRWINLGITTLQPSEFVKLSLAIYLAAWFSNKEKGRIWAFLLLIGFIIFLVMLQPDMGTAGIILFEALIIYFLSGSSLWHFALLLPAVSVLGFVLIKLAPYRANRLATFFNFNHSPQDYSYHVRQILIGLGAGGLTGVGIGNSLQKYAYLPENTTDSIFAIIAEEIGFLGAGIMICIFAVIIWRGFYIATHAKDGFGRLLAGGISAFLAIQILINLAAQTALIPLTGVPLPFISYGGSALIINFCSIGILLNIAKQGHYK